ncbi:hypothetical protein EJ05DRAFT_482832 [Pseudovirgaria hyperparasitica]|uniref:Transcription factor domain-containing protein n=1 Tax=Pseudovirgaria hyperparasitica TaxID=470096 RepID=A0A6A6WGP5_9PEZI|nr:uncharacterized protein EJ05DRAFT_482832 [Pseudovirgaria hyperparasitica]KAF2762032.1 hypothetical protein EJ05DRAFT_482832 [Pseudovirgaria hyperparasitica]
MPSRAQSYTRSQRTRTRRASNTSAPQKVSLQQHIPFTLPSPTSSVLPVRQSLKTPLTRHPHDTQFENLVPKQATLGGKPSNGSITKSRVQNVSLKFVTATGTLETFKDKQSLNEIRRHVMVDYLNKHQPEPNTLQRRRDSVQALELQGNVVENPVQQFDTLRGAISNEYALKLFKQPSKRKSLASSSEEDLSEDQQEHNKRPDLTGSLEDVNKIAQFDTALLTKFAKCDIVDIKQPLVIPADISSWTAETYQRRTLEGSSTGPPLDPFGTMVKSRHREVNNEALKYNCKFLYGSKAMVSTWTRDLGHTPHGYIATLYLSSTHIDVMRGLHHESIPTRLLRDESIQLIRGRVHPSTFAHDTTIQAALTVLCGEIIQGSSREAIQWHEDAILQMVSHRGGLMKLGFRELTAIIAMVFMQSAIFRESQAPETISTCMARLQVTTADPTKPVPESPLYCPRSDGHFTTIAVRCHPHTLAILYETRILTDLVVDASHPFRSISIFPGAILSEPEMHMQRLHARLQNRPSAHDNRHATYKDWTYEACRLAALVYSTAIAKRTSISAAVTMTSINRAQTETSPYAVLEQLKAALEKSHAADECWMDTKMTGVLFWITLVAGAACSRFLTRSPSLSTYSGFGEADSVRGEYAPQDSERYLRKWFTAISVRCTILMGFEHGIPVLLSLRKMLAVLELLTPGGGKNDWGEVHF